jgi:hypothetical protein
MGETLGVTTALHGLFPDFSPLMKHAWANMLMGSSPAWEGLIASDLNQEGHFRRTSSLGPSNAQVCAAATLFLYGIVPKTGSLDIQALEDSYPTKTPPIAACDFRFNYTDRTIRIPVRAGEISFIYGSTPVNYTFPAARAPTGTVSAPTKIPSPSTQPTNANSGLPVEVFPLAY